MHNLANACNADEALCNVEVLIENEGDVAVARQRGRERVEDSGECWRRGLNYALADRYGAVIESNFGHGLGSRVRVANQRGQMILPIYYGIRKAKIYFM